MIQSFHPMKRYFLYILFIILSASCEDDPDVIPNQNVPVETQGQYVGLLSEGMEYYPVDTILTARSISGERNGVQYIEYFRVLNKFEIGTKTDGFMISIMGSRYGHWYIEFYLSDNFILSKSILNKGDRFDSAILWGNDWAHTSDYDLADTAYIGIRKLTDSEIKYGWIKVKTIDKRTIHLIEYAF